MESDYQGAARRFIESGGNIRTTFTYPKVFIEPLRKSIVDGEFSIATIDDRVCDVLRVKYRLGLFDQPYRDPDAANHAIATAANKAQTLKAARECIVLLKNESIMLRLDRTKIKRILVTGPNAEETKIAESRYDPQHGKIISALEGIQSLAGKDIDVVHKKGSSHFTKTGPQRGDGYRTVRHRALKD